MAFKFREFFHGGIVNGVPDVGIAPLPGEDTGAEKFRHGAGGIVTEGEGFDDSVALENVEQSPHKFTDADFVTVKLKNFHYENEKCQNRTNQNDPHDRAAVIHQFDKEHRLLSPLLQLLAEVFPHFFSKISFRQHQLSAAVDQPQAVLQSSGFLYFSDQPQSGFASSDAPLGIWNDTGFHHIDRSIDCFFVIFQSFAVFPGVFQSDPCFDERLQADLRGRDGEQEQIAAAWTEELLSRCAEKNS
jgi:hypothetical protein